MGKATISTFELFEIFPDQESARAYFEGKRWPDGAVCPACSEAKRIGTRKGGFYRCNACLADFTVRTGTIFERSKVPLHKWLYAMYLLVTSRKGISSLQLAKQIGVTQKTAWFLLQRLRERGGRMKAKVVTETTSRSVYSFIRHNVEVGATLHTDEAAVYRPLNGLYYTQKSIN